jgi:hypothetical protein
MVIINEYCSLYKYILDNAWRLINCF